MVVWKSEDFFFVGSFGPYNIFVLNRFCLKRGHDYFRAQSIQMMAWVFGGIVYTERGYPPPTMPVKKKSVHLYEGPPN